MDFKLLLVLSRNLWMDSELDSSTSTMKVNDEDLDALEAALNNTEICRKPLLIESPQNDEDEEEWPYSEARSIEVYLTFRTSSST